MVISNMNVGIIDMFSMLGRFIATLYFVVDPPKKLNKTYFISVILQTVAFFIIIGGHYYP